MNIKRALLKVAANRLEEHGFSYSGKPDSLLWVFTKTVDQVEQYITIHKSRFSNKISLSFSTTLKPFNYIYWNKLVEGKESNVNIWCLYEDDQSLLQLIEEFVDIAIMYGLIELNILSIPDLKPSSELQLELLKSPQKRAQRFSERYSLDFGDEDIISKLEKLLLEIKEQVGMVEWDIILDASAFLGEFVRTKYSSEWGLNKAAKTPMVAVITPGGMVLSNPLTEVALFWGNPRNTRYSLRYQTEMSEYHNNL